MKTNRSLILLSALLALANALPASVSLQFEGPSTITVAPGQSFSLTLDVTSTGGETITGLDYYFNTDAGGSGLLSITGRDLTGSQFANFVNYDNTTVLASAAALLDPRDDYDLGGGTNSLSGLSGSSSYFVATYTFQLSASAVTGQTYSLFTNSITSATGWVGPGPNFSDNPFATPAMLSIMVAAIPEPTAYGLILGGVMLLGVLARRFFR